jgi:hypothetical protein
VPNPSVTIRITTLPPALCTTVILLARPVGHPSGRLALHLLLPLSIKTVRTFIGERSVTQQQRSVHPGQRDHTQCQPRGCVGAAGVPRQAHLRLYPRVDVSTRPADYM